MNTQEAGRFLTEFGIEGCCVRSAEIICFTTQKWTIDDTLEPRETMFFFYYPVKSEEKQWAIKEWDLMTGIHCCACFKPNERWVFISDPGEVFVIGQGDKGEESPIQTTSKNHFKTVKCIAGGYAYAAGVNRKIFKRIDKNTWQPMHSTEMIEKKKNAGVFNGIQRY